MEYKEFVFRAEFLYNKQAQAEKNMLVAASFTAWQLLCAKGLKTGWSDYISSLGLVDSKKDKKTDIEKDKETAMEIHRRLYNIK